jgi:RNA polymerase sigma factor (sigma-70 family)
MSPRLPISLLAAQSDRRLVELVGEGHERAFEVLVKRYRRQLLRYCRRIGLSDSRAEDVLQHAFLQAWLALERGVEVRAPKPWLYRIVHNSAVNVIRSSREEHTELVDDALADSYGSDLESGLVVRETLSDVAALPPLQREAMLMSAVDGRSHEEVADALGITHGAVRGLLYRARSTLRDAAAALIPQPLVSWAAGAASRGTPTAERLTQLSAPGASAGVGGMLVRAAAVAVTSAAVAVGVAVVPHHGHAAPSATSGSHAAGLAPPAPTAAQSSAVPGSQVTVVSAHRTAAAGGGTRLAISSAPTALTSPRRAPSPVGRPKPVPTPTSSAPSNGGSGGQHGTPSQASSVGVAASAPTSSAPPPAASPPKTEPPAAPPPTGSGGEKVKEEPVAPPPDDGSGGESDDGSEESHEGHPPPTEEPKVPPKEGEKTKTDD